MHLHRVAFQSLFTFCNILTLVARMNYVAMCLSFVPFIILKTACNVITLITRVSVIIVISLLMQFQRTIQRECFVAQITGILYPLMLYFFMNSQSMGNCSFVFALITTELLVSMNLIQQVLKSYVIFGVKYRLTMDSLVVHLLMLEIQRKASYVNCGVSLKILKSQNH